MEDETGSVAATEMKICSCLDEDIYNNIYFHIYIFLEENDTSKTCKQANWFFLNFFNISWIGKQNKIN